MVINSDRHRWPVQTRLLMQDEFSELLAMITLAVNDGDDITVSGLRYQTLMSRLKTNTGVNPQGPFLLGFNNPRTATLFKLAWA